MAAWPIHDDDDEDEGEGLPLGPPEEAIVQCGGQQVAQPRPLETFDAAVDAIVRAANKFRRVTGDEGETFVPGLDDTAPAYKMPLTAYCLSMAHRLWRETEQLAVHREHCEMRERIAVLQKGRGGSPPAPFGVTGSIGGALHPMPANEFMDVMVGMAANLDANQRKELVAQIQAQDVDEEPEPSTE